ncbi:TIM barrel protein [bacterium]|nr:TIM barrel protein [bacterium]
MSDQPTPSAIVDFTDRLSYLAPYDDLRIERAQSIGVRAIQLRLGPGFPIPTDRWDPAAVAAARDLLAARNLRAESIGYYRNHLHPDPAIREAEATGLRVVFQIARAFGVSVISVFAGRDPEKSVEDNLPMFVSTWAPLADEAEALGLRIAFENCTMYRGYPIRGINMAYSPHACQMMFDALPHPALGLEFDPSHCIKQRIDPLAMLRQFGNRILHVHLKDHEILEEAVQLYGSYDTRCSRDRFPGLGQVDFRSMFRALALMGYAGNFAIEAEHDPSVETEQEVRTALRLSVAYLTTEWASVN